MIRLTEKGFCIEVETEHPQNDCYEMMKDLIDALQSPDSNMQTEPPFYLYELLKAMMPGSKQIDKLLGS